MTTVGRGHPRHLGIGSSDHLHGSAVDMADGICPGPHRGGRVVGSSSGSPGPHDAVLPNSAGAWRRTAGALPTVAWARRRGGCLVQLLLVPEEEIASGKATGALGTLERLFLG